MIDIIINKNQCKLEGDELTTSLLQTLDRELSYEIEGARFMPAFQRGWDGRKHFFNNKLIFPRGCLDRVIKIFNNYSLSYNIIDNNLLTNSVSLDITDKLKSIKKTPYEYQIEAANKVTEVNCGIFKMATGSGKSLTMALMVAKLNKSSIIYVIGLSLLYQMHELFVSIFGADHVGIVGDGNCDIKTGPADINIVSVWTAGIALGVDKKKIINDDDDVVEKTADATKHQQIKKLISSAKVHIIDECHVCGCATLEEINKTINAEHIYGMSASPYSDDGSDLVIESILGSIVVNISASYLIERGFLAQPIIKFINVPKIMYPKEVKYPGIYKEYIIENEIRNNIVLENAKDLVSKGYKVLVLYKNIQHGKILLEKLKNEVPCILLNGKDKNNIRDAAKIKMESGEINCVIASNIFDIGLDWPQLSALICAGSGKSSIRSLQRIGRVIRKYGNKKFAAVIEFADNCRYLKDHTQARKKVYETEPKFKIIWPQKK